MKSKTSYFNKAIFRKNIERFWPLWSLYALILFFLMPFPLLITTAKISPHMTSAEIVSAKAQALASVLNVGTNAFIPSLFAVLIAIAVFGYLYTSRSCNMIHALPVRREELFCTNYLTGLFFLIIPQILMFFFCMFISIAIDIPSVEYLAQWLIIGIGTSFFFFSMAVLCCFLTGHAVAAVIYYYGFNFLYVVCKYLILELVSNIGFGMNSYYTNPGSSGIFYRVGDSGNCLSPLYYMLSKVSFNWSYNNGNVVFEGFSDATIVLGYVLATIPIILLTLYMYKKRQLEVAGDIIAISFLKPVFRWTCGFVPGLGIALLVTTLCFGNERYFTAVTILFLIFGCLAFFAAQMLLNKKFKIFTRRIVIEWLVFAGLSILLIVGIKCDFAKITSRIPPAEDVATATIYYHYPIDYTGTEEIQSVEELHQSILDHKQELIDYYNASMNGSDIVTTYISIVYNKKDGSSMTREYYIPIDLPDSDPLAELEKNLNTRETKQHAFLSYFFCKNYKEMQITGATLTFPEDAENHVRPSEQFSPKQAQLLYDALLQDLQDGSISAYQENEDYYYNDLYFSFTCPNGVQSYNGLPEYSDPYNTMSEQERISSVGQSSSICFSPKATHLIEAFKQLGITTDQLTTCAEYNAQWEEANAQ